MFLKASTLLFSDRPHHLIPTTVLLKFVNRNV